MFKPLNFIDKGRKQPSFKDQPSLLLQPIVFTPVLED